MEIKNFNVYKSSAGSGKTTTLVQEYLKIALINPARFREIVAITFTIKATNEMKSRVIDTLIDFSNGIFKPEMVALIEGLQNNQDFDQDKIIYNAKDLLAKILHGYSYFAFSTIDSFVVGIVRSFAFDLKLPMNFGIELQKEIIIDEAVSELLAMAGYEAKLTQFLTNFIENQVQNQTDTRIHVLLSKLSSVLFNDSYNDFVESLREITPDELYDFADEVLKNTIQRKNAISNIGKEALNLIHLSNLQDSDFFKGKTGIYKFFIYLTQNDILKFQPNLTTQKTIDDDLWYAQKTPSDIKGQIDSLKPKLTELYHKSILAISDFYAHHSIRANVESMALLKLMQDMIQNYYSENGVIHLSETLKKVAQIVESEQMPFIYERIGNQYNNYLIDEFQDTSVRQWHNLLPLIDDSLSNGNFNLLVGDAKQSIYRWRGGDFEQFVNMPNINAKDESQFTPLRKQTLTRNYNEIVLNKNYRSSKTVVNFNNRFYQYYLKNIADNEIVHGVFKDFEQLSFRKSDGYVEISLCDDEPQIENPIKDIVINIIKDLQIRGFKYSDMAILARKNSKLTEVANFLLDESIPIISSQSLNILASPHTKYLMNALKWLANNQDRVAALSVFNYLHQMGYFGQSIDFATIFMDFAKSNHNLFNSLNIDIQHLDTEDPVQICEMLASKQNLYAQDYSFIISLINFIHKSQNSIGNGLTSFLNYADLHIHEEFVVMPDDIDAIQLLTIHKSKGLEFPAVIFIDFYSQDSALNKDFITVSPTDLGYQKPRLILVDDSKILLNTTFSFAKQNADKLKEADIMNIAYVATTRAKDELYFITEPKAKYYNYLSGFVNSATENFAIIDNIRFSLGTKSDNFHVDFEKSRVDDYTENILTYNSFEPWQMKTRINQISATELKSFDENSDQINGTLIHDLFSYINIKSDLNFAIEHMVAEGKLNSSQTDFYRQLVLSIIDNEAIRNLFNMEWEVMNERNIVTNDGEIVRPDRVLISSTEVKVIDFKYSDPNNVSDNLKTKYINQVKDYMHFLKEIYPKHIICGYLLWLKEDVKLESVL
jgi:ATP-dependent exoDNAse (exonuclease V) beta subunit